MADNAYICLTEDNRWAVATSDGTQEIILAVGRPFTAGADIREAVAELEAWAHENAYYLTTPDYSVSDVDLQDLIEPEIFDEVFGNQDNS